MHFCPDRAVLGFQPWPVTSCCFLGQAALLSQCVSPLRCINTLMQGMTAHELQFPFLIARIPEKNLGNQKTILKRQFVFRWAPRLASEDLSLFVNCETKVPKPSSGTDLLLYGQCEFLRAVRGPRIGKASILRQWVLPFLKGVSRQCAIQKTN